MKHILELATSGVVTFDLDLDYVPRESVERWRRACSAVVKGSPLSPASDSAVQELLDAGDELAAWLSSPW